MVAGSLSRRDCGRLSLHATQPGGVDLDGDQSLFPLDALPYEDGVAYPIVHGSPTCILDVDGLKDLIWPRRCLARRASETPQGLGLDGRTSSLFRKRSP